MKRFFLIFFAICAAVTTFADTFRRVSAPQADWTGEYLLVFESEDSCRVFSGVDAAMGSEVVEITNSTISNYTGPTLVVAALADGGYSIAVNGGTNNGKYISSGISAPALTNRLCFNTTPHRVDLDYVNGSVLMSQSLQVDGQDTLVKMRFNDNPGQKRFRFYKTGQLPIQLYKLSSGDEQDSSANPILPIAQVKALDDASNVRLSGVVTHVYNKNAWIQDATGGMLLFFTASPSVSVGDEVVVSGVKTTYAGAPEVSYSVIETTISTGNEVAEVQCASLAAACQENLMFTKVHLENLEIVSFNNSGNPYVTDGSDTLLCYRMIPDSSFVMGSHINLTAIVSYYNGYQFVGDVAGIQLAQQPSLDSVAFNVIVPANTPDCYIAGNFNNWTLQQMTKLTDSTYTYVYSAVNLIIDSLEYKYCAGPDWAYVEKDAQGMEIMNRRWQALDRVATWAVVPGDTLPQDTVPSEQPTVPTIAQVKALENNTETQVAGVVTFIYNRNVYIQDATGGLLLYMSATPTFNVGDQVVVSGTKAMYGGAPELKNGVEVSAVADSIPAAASFATLADACQEANMFTLVNMNNLEIVSLDSYNNPSVSDGMDTLLCYRMAVDTAVFKVGTHVNVTAVLGYYNGYQFVGNAAGIQLAQQPSLDSVAFNVVVPANTPDCYIAGNFNGWTHQQMTKLTDSTYTFEYSAANLVIDSLEYKYCAGPDWAYVEKDAQGMEIMNRRWQAQDRVATWFAVPDEITDVNWALSIYEGHWSMEYAAFQSANTGYYGEVVNLSKNGGYVSLVLTQEMLDAARTQQGWGGIFVLNGDNVICHHVILEHAGTIDTIWVGNAVADNWENQPYIGSDGGAELANAQVGDIVKFFITAVDIPRVIFTVVVPSNTENCYIAGNFNNWTHQQMIQYDDTLYSFSYSAIDLVVDSIEYKYCAGPGWAYVEKDAEGLDVPNRKWQPLDTVVAWENTRLVHNGLHYEITSMNTVCVIPASDNEGNGNYLWLTDVVIPDTVVFNNTTYQVTGIAEMAFAGCRTMTSLVVGKNIEQIGLLAFQNCSNLTSVVWNATNCSSIVIDNNVYPFFYSVQSITSFTFGNSVEFVPAALCAFMENLTSITIPEGVSVLEGYVFYYCSSLASITLPSTLTYINANAFNGCEGLTKTNFTGNLKNWCEMIIFEGGSPVMYSHNLYLNDVLLTHADIPEGTTMVNDYAFANDTCLISAKVPNSVEYIGLYAFNNCTNIRSIEVGNGVSELALTDYNYSYAFSECYNLQKFVYRSSLADDLRLGDYWLNATNLDTLIVPTEMLELDDDWAVLKSIVPSHIRYIEVLEGELGSSSLQFFGLSAASLQTLNLAAASNTTLEDKAFYEFYNLTNLSLPLGLQTIPYKMVADCYMLSSISIPSSVTSIGNNAFENCRSLSSVDFGTMTALQQIGNWAFYNCHNLPNLTIPEGVTYVGDGAFYGCSYLTELTLPSTMLTMGDNSFALCSRLQKMNVSAVIPPTIASKTFKDVLRSIPVYVPQPSVSLYKTDEYWKEFNIIGSEEQESGVDNISSEGTTKIYRDGHVLIYHNGKYYDLMGNVVE